MKIALIKPDVSKFTKITNFTFWGISFVIVIITITITGKFASWKKEILYALYITFFGLGLIQLVRSFVSKDFKRIGAITLGIDSIAIETNGKRELHDLNKIDSMKVTYYGYDGESSFLMGWKQEQGDRNKIELLISGEIFSYEFYLNRYNEKVQLFRLLNYYEKNGVNVNFTNEFGNDNLYKKV